MLDDLNEVQPIDDYVKMLLRSAKEDHKLNINTENPTRGERLEAALVYDGIEPWSAVEIMVGKRIDAQDPTSKTLMFLLMTTDRARDPQAFYAGYAHQYRPGEKRE